MEHSLALALNRFPVIPDSLRQEPRFNAPRSGIFIALGSLYHHYYLDCYGVRPPDPDPANFEYLRFLCDTKDFRFRGEGVGVSTVVRRTSSTAMGQAFCRLFLHDHLNITYFAHTERVIGQRLHPGFGGLSLQRVANGDIPDYVCAENVNRVYLAEAKGRYDFAGFGSREFSFWRNQFERVEVRNSSGGVFSAKGYIVATRFATEKNRPTTLSTVYAEDPRTPGEVDLDQIEIPKGGRILSIHYGGIAEKLGQPILAAALLEGFVVPEEIQFSAVIWEFLVGPFAGRRFVGGYFAPRDAEIPIRKEGDKLRIGSADPFRLGPHSLCFFGLEESIFRQVVKIARGGVEYAADLATFDQVEPFYSGVSVLRDGSLMSPVEFLAATVQEFY